MPVHSIHIDGYRSIRSLHLDLGRITVVVGANGTGKTNVYRAVRMLSVAAEGRLSHTLAEEGGIPSVLWAGKRGRNEPGLWSVEVEMDDLAYQLSCGIVPPPQGPFKLDPEVKEERLWVLQGKRRHLMAQRESGTAFVRDAEGKRTTFPAEIWGGESLLAQLTEPHRFPLLSIARSEFLRWRFYHHFRTDPAAPLRSPQVGVRTPALAHDGRDLAAALTTIDEIGDRGALHAAVERAFPGSNLELAVDDGRFSFQLRSPGLLRPLSPTELSDGTIRYLCLVAALLSPRAPPFLALNEPETSLHSDLLEPLAELIVDASSRSQIFVTTHAQRLAERLHRSGAFCVELAKVEGATGIVEPTNEEP
jgi:predicted ATPase